MGSRRWETGTLLDGWLDFGRRSPYQTNSRHPTWSHNMESVGAPRRNSIYRVDQQNLSHHTRLYRKHQRFHPLATLPKWEIYDKIFLHELNRRALAAGIQRKEVGRNMEVLGTIELDYSYGLVQRARSWQTGRDLEGNSAPLPTVQLASIHQRP